MLMLSLGSQSLLVCPSVFVWCDLCSNLLPMTFWATTKRPVFPGGARSLLPRCVDLFGLGVFSASLLELVNFRRFLLKHPIGTESVLNPCLPAVPHQQIARPRHSSVRRAAPPSLALSRQVWKLGGLVDMQGGPPKKTNIAPI